MTTERDKKLRELVDDLRKEAKEKYELGVYHSLGNIVIADRIEQILAIPETAVQSVPSSITGISSPGYSTFPTELDLGLSGVSAPKDTQLESIVDSPAKPAQGSEGDK